MKRSIRRYHTLRVRTRRLRLHYDLYPRCLINWDSNPTPIYKIIKHAPCWPDCEPKWWQKAYNLQPSRIRQNRLLRAVVRGIDPDAIPRWPDYRKPRSYYW